MRCGSRQHRLQARRQQSGGLSIYRSGKEIAREVRQHAAARTEAEGETLESYLAKRVMKEAEQIARSKKKKNKREAQEAMNRIFEGNCSLENFDVNQLDSLALLAADKLKQLNLRKQNPKKSSIVEMEVDEEEEEEGDDDHDDDDDYDDEDEAIMFQAQMIDPIEVGLDDIFKEYDQKTVDRHADQRELGMEDFFLDYDRPGLGLGLVFRGVDRNVDDQDASGSVPKSVQQLMDDKWFMETMTAGPSQTEPPSESTVTTSQIGPSDIEKPPDSADTTTTTVVDAKEEEELPDDLNAVFPHIYSP